MNQKKSSLFLVVSCLFLIGLAFQNCSLSDDENSSGQVDLLATSGDLKVQYDFLSEPKLRSNVMILATAIGGAGDYSFEFLKNGSSFSKERMTVVNYTGSKDVFSIKVKDSVGDEVIQNIKFPGLEDGLGLEFSVYEQNNRAAGKKGKIIVFDKPIAIEFSLGSSSGEDVGFLSERYWQEGKPSISNGQYKMVWNKVDLANQKPGHYVVEPSSDRLRFLRPVVSDPENPSLKFSGEVLMVKNSYIDTYSGTQFDLSDSKYELLAPTLRSQTCPYPYFVSSLQITRKDEGFGIDGMGCIRLFDEESNDVVYKKSDLGQYVYYSSIDDVVPNVGASFCHKYTDQSGGSPLGLVSLDSNKDYSCTEMNLPEGYVLSELESVFESTDGVGEIVKLSCSTGKFAVRFSESVLTFPSKVIRNYFLACANISKTP